MKKFLLLSVVLLFAIVAMLPARAGALLTPEFFASTGFSYGAPVPEYYGLTKLWDNQIAWIPDPADPTKPDMSFSGIHATNKWAQDNTQLGWTIMGSGGLFTYEYWWSTSEKKLSHIIIELTGIAWEPADNIIFNDSGFDYEIEIRRFLPGEGNSNPGMPHSLFGVKADLVEEYDIFMFSFTVAQAPVWGNFYAKGGDVYAYNTGFDPQGTGVFIPRPDGAPIPEPATMLLLGAGMIGLAGIGRKRLWKR